MTAARIRSSCGIGFRLQLRIPRDRVFRLQLRIPPDRVFRLQLRIPPDRVFRLQRWISR